MMGSQSYRVLGLDLVIVSGFSKSKGKHALLLQIRLVNASEASGDNSKAA